MSWPCVQWLRDIEGFPRGVKPIAHAVALRVDEDKGRVWRGVAADIAADAGCSVKTVNRALKWMDGAGMLERKAEHDAAGHKVRQRIRFVILDQLPEGLTIRGSEKIEEDQIKDTMSFRTENDPGLKDSVSSLKDKTDGPKGHGVQPKGHGVPSSTTLPTHSHTHTTSARVNENSKSSSDPPPTAVEVEAGFERFVKAFPPERLDQGLDLLRDLFVAECKSIAPRSATELAAAAEVYRRKQTAGCVGLSASKFLQQKTYEHHLPKARRPASPGTSRVEAPDWVAAFAAFDERGADGWPTVLGPPPGVPGFSAPPKAIDDALRRARNPRHATLIVDEVERLAGGRYGSQYRNVSDHAREREAAIRNLVKTGAWESGSGLQDPRDHPGAWPPYLLADYKLEPARTAA